MGSIDSFEQQINPMIFVQLQLGIFLWCSSIPEQPVRSKESSRKRIFGKYLVRTGQKIKVQVIRVVEEGVEDWGCEMNFIRRSCKDE